MSSLEKQRKLFIMSSLAIPVFLLVCFVVFPAIDLFRMSFTNWDGLSKTSDFIMFDNYVSMFKNPDLWQSLKNNGVYFVVHLCMIPIELAFAVLLNGKLRAAKFYKTMVFLPYIINGVAISYAFSYFFSPVNGAFDSILETIKLGMLSGHGWLSDEKIINFTLAFVSLWRFSGYHIILFMAALQSVNQDIMEAARIDRANSWQLFRYIQTPSIALMVDFVLFDNIRGAMQVFDIPFVMTQAIKQIICIGMVIIVMLPILVTVFAAFKTRADMVNTSPLALPPEPTLENFKEVLTNKRLITGVKNTLLILAVSLFFNILLGTITAYIIERFNFRFKKVVVALFFVGMLVPTFVTEIARFKIINGLGLYGSPGAPILIYVASDLMQLYIYRQFLSNLSTSLDESALLDGCNYFQLFTKIIFPLLAPATAMVAIIKSITIINDMYIPYLYMPGNKQRTLTTFLMDYANAQQGSWQSLAAGIVIIMLPTVVLYVFFQKYILAGVAAGAVKE